jgi:hypothetical protein
MPIPVTTTIPADRNAGATYNHPRMIAPTRPPSTSPTRVGRIPTVMIPVALSIPVATAIPANRDTRAAYNYLRMDSSYRRNVYAG